MSSNMQSSKPSPPPDTPPSPSRFRFKDPRARPSRRDTARRLFHDLVTTAKDILQISSIGSKLERRRSRRYSKLEEKQLPPLPPQHPKRRTTVTIRDLGTQDATPSDPLVPRNFSRNSYRVASASQLNGRYVEHAIRAEQHQYHHYQHHPDPSSLRTQSLRNRQAPVLAPPPTLIRSRSTPLLVTPSPPPLPDRSSDTSSLSRYSPALSTIVEQTEPEGPIRPISEVLSIGEARIARLLPTSASDYETSISRFAAKATKLIGELGPTLQVYAMREMDIQCAPGFQVGEQYFRPHVTKLFTKVAVCDTGALGLGDPIRFASKGFELSSAGLEVGQCRYLNLYEQTRSNINAKEGLRSRVILRTERDPLAAGASKGASTGSTGVGAMRYIAHFMTPVYDEGMRERYNLVAQIDVTNALRRLALQESASTTTTPTNTHEADAKARTTSAKAVSPQLRRFLSFIYWLGGFHSNALCFTKVSHVPSISACWPLQSDEAAGEVEAVREWQLRFAAKHIQTEKEMKVESSEAEMAHMALSMDGEVAFCQGVVWGNGGRQDRGVERSDSGRMRGGASIGKMSRFSENFEGSEIPAMPLIDAKASPSPNSKLRRLRQDKGRATRPRTTSYLQYCVPVTDGRSDGRGEKWWVCFLVGKQVPGFWGRSLAGGGEEIVEYPFLV